MCFFVYDFCVIFVVKFLFVYLVFVLDIFFLGGGIFYELNFNFKFVRILLFYVWRYLFIIFVFSSVLEFS